MNVRLLGIALLASTIFSPPLPGRGDVPKVPLPDTSQRQAEANAAAGRLSTARQVLTQATATRLPSLSMDAIRQQIVEVNKAKCD
jgi:hypothetical protein